MCEWTGELGDLQHHCSTCPLELLPCPNKCIKDGQEVKVARKNIQKHLEEECLNRSYTCPHCDEEGTYLEQTVAHAEKCAKMPISCPNAPCTVVAIRAEMEKHRKTECLHAPATCCHADVGCSAELSRKDLLEHQLDTELHLKTAKLTIAALRKNLEATSAALTKYIKETKGDSAKLELKMKGEMAAAVERVHMMKRGQTTFKMPNFSTHKTNQTEFKSPAFYTGLRGYRMCVIVEAQGVSKAKGAYVSIYAHLMRGEYDDNLPWPLVGTVTFELLNQLGNHSHRKQTCNFPPDDKDNHRVTDKDIANTGYGCPKFVSHAKLGIGGAQEVPKDVQYLKGDAIYLRVSVEAPDSVNHDWLRCY